MMPEAPIKRGLLYLLKLLRLQKQNMQKQNIQNENMQKQNIQNQIKQLSITIGTLVLVTLMSFVFREVGIHETNIIVAYILGVLIVSTQTIGYFHGILASVIGVLTFNFFFTEPYYTFVAYRTDYPVTFLIMFIAAMMTSTLAEKVKSEKKRVEIREQRTLHLYRISQELIRARNVQQIVDVCSKELGVALQRGIIIQTQGDNGKLCGATLFNFKPTNQIEQFKLFYEQKGLELAYQCGTPTGFGTSIDNDLKSYYHPIKGQIGVLGVVGVDCFEGIILNPEQIQFLEAVCMQMAIALDRERLWGKQQKTKMEIEKERLRGNLLRGISHDLRTPLAGILGSTGTLIENDNTLTGAMRHELLFNIYEEVTWLIHTIENILSMTRIDEGKMEIHRSMEAAEELVAEAVYRIRKIASKHIVKTVIPENLVMVSVDSGLIEQVLINLLDNAMKYTEEGTMIEVSFKTEENKVVFEVKDYGKGMLEEEIPYVFERFYTSSKGGDSNRKGTGLGLAICKSIVNAHGGEIQVNNHSQGGACFTFYIPN